MLLTTILYLVIIYTIYKTSFFKTNSIHKFAMPFFFSLKVIAGVVLYYIYTNYYKDKATGDVNKYFDDATEIYKALDGNVKDYFKILFNIDCNTPQIIKYLSKINHWDLKSEGNFFVNDARTVIRFNLLLLPISGSYYYFHSLVLNLFSFIGAVYIYNVFCAENHERKVINSVLCFLIPSVLFWCSGVLKEGLLLFFLGLAIKAIHQLLITNESKKIINFLILCFAMFGILLTKFYVAFALLPAIIFLLLNKFQFLKNWRSALLIFLLGGVFLYSENPLTKIFKEKLIFKQKEFVNVARGGYYFEVTQNNRIDTIYIEEKEGKNLLQSTDSIYLAKKGCLASYYKNLEMSDNLELKTNSKLHLLEHIKPVNSSIYLPTLNNSFISIIKALPIALFNSLFLPMPWGIKNVMYIMPVIENLLLFFLIIWLIIKYKGIKENQKQFIWFCFIYSICLLIITGITTPVLGALVRYKVPALPFIFFILTSFIDFKPRQSQ